ncbi:PREDICTED: uncharacterized protein LOC108563225 isoform X2 [Nicrophorus vespilloides]|uniref:Uncharacterized protein LOC108563225 isoform X2 n=1 Tax=Nicrophorus vespilloides TaxID=110193 RepID=A0ABM1MRX9_NICVS|nr:PREDICTED: uncharacterized protein LOC108563225 isoform X2 [Nicrophorus vespilloides]
MSGSYPYYYTPQPPGQYSEWTLEQQQFNQSSHSYTRGPPVYEMPMPAQNQISAAHTPIRSSQYYNYHGSNHSSHNGRPYHSRRYNGPSNQYSSSQSQNWRQGYKRQLDDDNEPKKPPKKKKKPLSQNMPSKKDWSLKEAEMALNCEKEYNKRHKNQSLIIKFPDPELNKDIVSKFHGAIENVHFQQPSTARFCFVTLMDTADGDAVINALNKVEFGGGKLTAEYKKDREDDQNIGPEDIDPNTLYVGNLAQEITKEDMIKTYPKCKRIDIGYAKKMKYTRYAFVTFRTVTDSIEAFKKTHSTQMYSKSLIVRFRRLHGTVGMPGESKPQNPPKNREPTIAEEAPRQPHMNHNHTNVREEPEELVRPPTRQERSPRKEAQSPVAIKQEPEYFPDPQQMERLKMAKLMPHTENYVSEMHKPRVINVKKEPKEEVLDDDECREVSSFRPVKSNKESDDKVEVNYIKPEPEDDFEYHDSQYSDEDANEYEDDEFEGDDEPSDFGKESFSSFYERTLAHAQQLGSLNHND